MLISAVDKIVDVEHALGVLSNFYGWKDASPQILAGNGIVQVVILLAFLALIPAARSPARGGPLKAMLA